MIRSLAILTLFAACSQADAQFIIQTVPRPGVIQAPVLPLPGSPLQHSVVRPPQPRFKSAVLAHPYYNLWGYAGYLPWYEPTPATTVVNNIYLPVPESAIIVPPPAAELRARLTLNIPPGSRVWLAGKEVDAAVAPLILESPVLREGQTYSFEVRVTWIEGRSTEERKRTVVVDAGDNKSLTHFAAR